jgi:hypothetical protein
VGGACNGRCNQWVVRAVGGPSSGRYSDTQVPSSTPYTDLSLQSGDRVLSTVAVESHDRIMQVLKDSGKIV